MSSMGTRWWGKRKLRAYAALNLSLKVSAKHMPSPSTPGHVPSCDSHLLAPLSSSSVDFTASVSLYLLKVLHSVGPGIGSFIKNTSLPGYTA